MINLADKADHFPTERTVAPHPKDLVDVAEFLLEDGDIKRWRGDWWVLDESGRWESADREDFENRLKQTLRDCDYIDGGHPKRWAPTAALMAEILSTLKEFAALPTKADAPFWLADEDDQPPASECIVVGNSEWGQDILHLPTRDVRDGELFTPVSISCGYDEDAQCPEWELFLKSLWGDDEKSIAALQEIFGYVIAGKANIQKLFLIVGPKRSGKGTIVRILENLIGEGNHTGTSLAQAGEKFGLQSLIGKSLAVVGDARLAGRNMTATTERLLSISGEDTQTVQRKYRVDWTGRLGVRFLILSNEMPAFPDASGTIASRFVILRTTKSWAGCEDLELQERLLRELPGILNWSLDGRDRIVDAGRFTEPASMANDHEDMLYAASPIQKFGGDVLQFGEEFSIRGDDIFALWSDWAKANGEKVGTSATFGRDFKAAYAQIEHKQRRVDGGSRTWFYLGVTGVLGVTG